MVDALRKAKADEVKLSVYPKAAHDSWITAYNDVKLWCWMLGRRRGDGRKETREMDGVAVPENNKFRQHKALFWRLSQNQGATSAGV